MNVESIMSGSSQLSNMVDSILSQFTQDELKAFMKDEGIPCLCWDCVVHGPGTFEKLIKMLEQKNANNVENQQ